MLIAGILIAVVSGLANTFAAALQKKEAVVVGTGLRALRLLAALVRRPWWLIAIAMSVLGWAGQAAALAFAPIAAVAPLMGVGRVLLVVIGVKWLRETFGRIELLGMALATVGAAVAAVFSGGTDSYIALSTGNLLLVGALGLVTSTVVALKRTGLAYGIGSGLAFAATAVYTKEIGDAFVRQGLHAIPRLLVSPILWGTVLLAGIGQAYIQSGLQRANAASVSAASAVVTMNGLLAAGFVLYDQPFPSGIGGVLLGVALAASVVGALMLSHRATDTEEELASEVVAHESEVLEGHSHFGTPT